MWESSYGEQAKRNPAVSELPSTRIFDKYLRLDFGYFPIARVHSGTLQNGRGFVTVNSEETPNLGYVRVAHKPGAMHFFDVATVHISWCPSMTVPLDPHTKAYVCRHVFDRSRPILLVSRADGDWCFLCGGYHQDDASDYRVVGIGHVIDSDKSLNELNDLQMDWEAERQDTESAWVRTRVDAATA